MKILINAICVKRFSGGMYQIAYNFIRESMNHSDVEWYYLVSADLDSTLRDDYFNKLLDVRYFVFPTQPDILGTYWKVRGEVRRIEETITPDVVYSICAPSYFFFNTLEVMRCTNPWVTHPNRYAQSTLSLKDKFIYFAKILNEKIHLQKCEYFITQSQTCKNGIVRVTDVNEKHVKVVPNVLPAIFKEMNNEPIVEGEAINIACVGNPVPHKNFDIIPDVLSELQKIGINNVVFHTTLPFGCSVEKNIKKRLESLSYETRLCNHGRLSQQKLGEMYRRCQLCYLPTLLEVFSASTVEAMFFQLPIVATDFEFNKEIMEDSCLYCKPKDAKDAASKIATLIANRTLQDEMKKKMQSRLAIYGNYDDHFNATTEFLIKVARREL